MVYLLNSTYVSLLENHTEASVLVLSSIGIGNSFTMVGLQIAYTSSSWYFPDLLPIRPKLQKVDSNNSKSTVVMPSLILGGTVDSSFLGYRSNCPQNRTNAQTWLYIP